MKKEYPFIGGLADGQTLAVPEEIRAEATYYVSYRSGFESGREPYTKRRIATGRDEMYQEFFAHESLTTGEAIGRLLAFYTPPHPPQLAL